VKYDIEAIQKRMDKAKPDYKEDKAKVRQKRAEQAKTREIKKMREIMGIEK